MLWMPWWLWSLFATVAAAYGIAAAAHASNPTAVGWAAGVPVWAALALLVRRGRRSRGRVTS